MRTTLDIALVTSALVLAACSDSAAKSDAGSVPDAGAVTDAGGSSVFETGTELRVPVPATGRVYVKLAPPALVSPGADPKTSAAWDLAFEGLDVFTNSGPSGSGSAAAFGPLDAITFLGDEAPVVPFLSPDKAGGAFLDWYAYEGSTHALWSRYHVYGVAEGTRLWKVQILGYYGQRDGATIPGLYKVRYAELTAAGAGPTQEIDIDGSAGGAAAPATTPSECLDLASGAKVMLGAEAARLSSAWHLCFRRASISVNGEMGGPRGIGAVDLEAAAVAGETVAAVQTRTSQTERAKFDATTRVSFDGKALRGDRIVSAFGDAWLDTTKTPLAPADAAWLVMDAAGKQKLRVGFSSFEGPTTTSPGTVVMRIKPAKE